MFEGKPPSSAAAHPFGEPQDGESLRPLSWSDLVARLAAARDLRGSLGDDAPPADGSFDAGCARRIAAQHNGKHSVNLDDLGNGKTHAAIPGPAVHGDASGVARN